MACTRAGGSEDADVGQTEEGRVDTRMKTRVHHAVVEM